MSAKIKTKLGRKIRGAQCVCVVVVGATLGTLVRKGVSGRVTFSGGQKELRG